jgi:hypothetical protein
MNVFSPEFYSNPGNCKWPPDFSSPFMNPFYDRSSSRKYIYRVKGNSSRLCYYTYAAMNERWLSNDEGFFSKHHKIERDTHRNACTAKLGPIGWNT